MSGKIINTKVTESYALCLTKQERDFLINLHHGISPEYKSRIKAASDAEPILLSEIEVDDIYDELIEETHRTRDKAKQKKFYSILDKLEEILDETCEHEDVEDEDYDEEDNYDEDEDEECEIDPEFIDIHKDLLFLIDNFCKKYLNEEYRKVCFDLADAVCTTGSPADRGKRESWASGIVYLVGQVNFLSDPSHDPNLRPEDIAKGFGISAATMRSKAKIIRDGMGFIDHDPRLMTENTVNDPSILPMQKMITILNSVLTEAMEEAITVDSSSPSHISFSGKLPINLIEGMAPQPQKNSAHKITKKTKQLYQIKITLKNIKPPVWRRIIVPDCTLNDLHHYIQAAMGWYNCHLHHFYDGDYYYGAPGPFGADCYDDMEDSTNYIVSEFFHDKGDKIYYEYDFGDGWDHVILLEKILPKAKQSEYPICVKGKRSCPPEDCGGPWGYQEFIEAISNPKHEEHEEMLEWCGGSFDPEEFDANFITQQLKRFSD